MKSKGRKRGGAYRRKQMALSLHAKQGKDRTRQNRQDAITLARTNSRFCQGQNHSGGYAASLEYKVKLRGLKIETAEKKEKAD